MYPSLPVSLSFPPFFSLKEKRKEKLDKYQVWSESDAQDEITLKQINFKNQSFRYLHFSAYLLLKRTWFSQWSTTLPKGICELVLGDGSDVGRYLANRASSRSSLPIRRHRSRGLGHRPCTEVSPGTRKRIFLAWRSDGTGAEPSWCKLRWRFCRQTF